jgi:GTP-dependent phosphoenolpyruvate carboxykinase
MGAELYAVADAELTWKIYRHGETTVVAEKSHKVSDVRRDNRDEARKRSRTQVCEEAFPLIHAAMEKLR